MSKIDRAHWQNPFTREGLRIPHGPTAGVFQIHEAGAMTVDEKWSHEAVCSPFWRLFYELTPGAWVQCGGKRTELTPDKLVLLPEGVTFDCGARQSVEHLWLHFSLRLSRPVTSPNLLVLPVTPASAGLLVAMRTAIAGQNLAEANHLGMALLHVAFAGLGPDWLVAPSARLQRVLSWLGQNLNVPINNELLAVQAGLGQEAFIRWFKQHMGRTPAVYVAERRVQEACRRLALTDESIEQIAEGLGFCNRHHFSRVFARYAGCGPAKFRKSGWSSS